MSKAKTEKFKTLDGDNGGIDWRATDATDVNGRYSIKTTIREQLAKIAAVLDVVFRRSPKFLGPRVENPGIALMLMALKSPTPRVRR